MIRAVFCVVGLITATVLAVTPVSERTVLLAALLAVCFVVVSWPARQQAPAVSPHFEKAPK